MATNNFTFRITTEDGDGNTATENVSVNSGPAEASPPTVTFNFPSGVRVEAGDGVDPYWGAGTKLAPVFCKVFPTARPTEGGNGEFEVQYYSTAAKHPNSPDRRFSLTHEGVGGQLSLALTNEATDYITVSSGIGITGSGLCQSADLVGFRKAIQITTDATSTSTGTRTTRFGRTTRIAGRRITIGDDDEGISAYHHNLSNNRVYTLERGNRAHGRVLKAWEAGANINLHPYHYVPMYSNAGAFDILVKPHIMVSETGTQYPLTGRVDVTGTAVVGTNTDFLNEISGGGTGSYHVSGATNIIRFDGTEHWYIISGVLSSSGLTIYDYGDSLAITDKAAEVNAYTLGSGTVAIQPDLTGCNDWDVRITPQYEVGDTVSSLSVDYTATIDATKVGGAISGTPGYFWEVDISGVSTTPTWSGLVPGNIATQTVVYTANTSKRVRVTVSGFGQLACQHQYDTGDLSLVDGISAGTWKSVQTSRAGHWGEVESNIRTELVGSRQADKYYHHNLTAMKPKQTETTSSVSQSSTTINVTPGTIDSWPNKGTVIIRGNQRTLTTPNHHHHQQYFRVTYTGKTNSSLTGLANKRVFEMQADRPYDQRGLRNYENYPSTISAGHPVWIQQMQPHPFSTVEAVISNNRVRLRDVAGMSNGSTIKWVRFFTAFDDTGYRSRGGQMFDQPYRIISTSSSSREITLDRNLDHAIAAGMLCVMQPYTDANNGDLFPSSVSYDRLNFLNTSAWMVYQPSSVTTTLNKTGTGTGIKDYLYIWDPMHNIMRGDYEERQGWRLPPVGRMIFPRGTSSTDKGIVIEYNGVSGPLTPGTHGFGNNVNGITGARAGVYRLYNVRIVADLTKSTIDEWEIGPRTGLIPYQDADIIPLSVLTFESTDADIAYSFNGGTSKHLGWSQPLANEVFVSDDITKTRNSQGIVTIPIRTNYESQHYPEFPDPAVRSAPPVYINDPEGGGDDGDPGGFYNPGGPGSIFGCIHYDSIVEIWNGESYDKMKVKDVKVGQLIRTPDGPKEVLDRLESRHGHTRIINTSGGRTLHCTHIHPIATVQKNGKIVWKKAAFIEQGEDVMTDTGPQKVDSNIYLNFTGRTAHPFYDLSVADVHQFFANGILVHNKVWTATTFR